MTAASTSIAPVVEDDIEDLEDLGGAETADGVRVTRDLPPVVTLRAKRSASRAAVGGGGANTDGVGHRSRANDSDGRGAQSDDDNDEDNEDDGASEDDHNDDGNNDNDNNDNNNNQTVKCYV